MAPLLPLLGFLKRSSVHDLRSDLLAGLTVGVLLVPQGMAYGLLAGLPPVVGLYASTLPLVAYGLLGTSRVLAVGPVAVVSMLTLGAVAPLAGPGTPEAAGLAVTLALLSGAVLLLMGVLRAGFLVNFLSHPVLSGFTSASAVLIVVSQLGPLVGVRVPRGQTLVELLPGLVSGLPGLHPVTAAVGLGSVAALLVFKRWVRRVPGALVVVAASIGLTVALDLDTRHGLAVVGAVPAGLPPLSLPGLDGVGALLPAAVAIALVGYVESISVAQGFARRVGERIDPGRELFALAAANAASAVVSGLPVTGGFSRTAVAADAGVKSPLASVVAAGTVAVVLLWFTAAFERLPLAALSATIVVAVAGLVDLRAISHAAAIRRRDAAALVLTLVVTLGVGVEQGIVAGVALSIGMVLWRIARPHVARLGRVPGTSEWRNTLRHPEAEVDPRVYVLRVDASLYFSNAGFLRDEIERVVFGAPPEVLVLDCSAVNDVDVSAAEALIQIAALLAGRGVAFRLVRVKGPVADVLRRTELLDQVRCYETVDAAVAG